MLHRVERKTQDEQGQQWKGKPSGTEAQLARAQGIRELIRSKTSGFLEQKNKVLDAMNPPEPEAKPEEAKPA